MILHTRRVHRTMSAYHPEDLHSKTAYHPQDHSKAAGEPPEYSLYVPSLWIIQYFAPSARSSDTVLRSQSHSPCRCESLEATLVSRDLKASRVTIVDPAGFSVLRVSIRHLEDDQLRPTRTEANRMLKEAYECAIGSKISRRPHSARVCEATDPRTGNQGLDPLTGLVDSFGQNVTWSWSLISRHEGRRANRAQTKKERPLPDLGRLE